MKAIVVTELLQGPSELVVGTLPIPSLPEGRNVLVDVKAAGANFFDILLIQGKYQHKPALPFVPGSEFSGVVRELGSKVKGLKVGDRVMGFLQNGAYAETVSVDSRVVLPMPKGMSFAKAAGFLMTYCTSHYALISRGEITSRDVVLVHAAAGGVGTAAVQIAKAAGCVVIATGGSAEKLDVAKRAGADHLINYREDMKWDKTVLELTNGKGADVVYDPVGGDVFDRSTRCTAWNGKILVIGFASGRIPTLQVNRALLKGISIVGVFFGRYTKEEPLKYQDTLKDLYRMFEAGQIDPIVYAEYPLENICEALTAIQDRSSYGKVIVSLQAPKSAL